MKKRGYGTEQAMWMIVVVLLFANKYLFAIFTETEALIELAGQMMRIMAVGYIAVSVTQVMGGVMRGAGDTMTPMWISLISTVLIRVPVAYGISYLTRTPELPFGYKECIQISLLITWIIGAILTTVFYARGKWKDKAIK